MVHTNPYEPPQTQNELLAKKKYPDFEVHGQYLLVKSGAQLPRRCISTNQLVEERQRVDLVLKWAASFRPAWRYKRCRLAYYISEEKKREHRRNLWLGILFLIVVAILQFAFVGASGLILVILGGFAIMSVGNLASRLRVVRHRDGRFWIAGLSRDFLAGMVESPDGE